MAKLTTAQRNSLHDTDFAIPSQRAYPIHDLPHAYAAIKDSAGKPEEGQVRSAVCKRWGLGCSIGVGGTRQ